MKKVIKINEPTPPIKNTNVGLGDRVERIAQPIARAIDRVAGTNIRGCSACQGRRKIS